MEALRQVMGTRANEYEGAQRNCTTAARRDVPDCASNRRPGADGVVHDRDPSPRDHIAKRGRNLVPRTPFRYRPLGEGKAVANTVRDQLRQQGPTRHRTADQVGLMRRDLGRQRVDERSQPRRFDEEPLEVEPPVSVVPRLEAEMTGASGSRG